MRKDFSLSTTLMGKELRAEVTVLNSGVQVLITGGSLPHIGAVSLADGQGNCTTQQLPGHKDGVVSEAWAKAIGALGLGPVAVSAGIHYDALSREQIQSVVDATEELLRQAVARLTLT
jgi:hypothetical protein